MCKYAFVFGGGAIRGMSYIGAVKALENLGISSNVIAGSSVGAIIAGMYALDYTSQEMQEIFLKVNFDLFKDIYFGFSKNFAISKGEVFLDWVREIVEKKFYGDKYSEVNPRVTFKDLDKDLIIITTDLTNFKCMEFSKSKTPDFEVATAIRISSTMPGLMSSYDYNGLELVDGDLQKSWPLWALSEELLNTDKRILEFRLEGSYNENSKGPVNYLNTVYSCVTSIATKFVVDTYDNCDKYDYVVINTGDLVIIDFNIPIDKRQDLINTGYEQTYKKFTQDIILKKEKLLKYYKSFQRNVIAVETALNKKDVNKAKLYLGEIYMDIFEYGKCIDSKYCKLLNSAKVKFLKDLKKGFWGYYSSLKISAVKNEFTLLNKILQEHIEELHDYVKQNRA